MSSSVQADDINFNTRHAGNVIRYHAWPTLRQQTIADHTWQVIRIYLELFGPPSIELFVYMQQHDQTEIATGDSPYHIKKANPDLKVILDRMESSAAERMNVIQPQISGEERLRFKFCDVLEMYEFGHFEVMMGNRFAEPILQRTGVDLLTRMAYDLSAEEIESVTRYVNRHKLPPFQENL